MTHKMTTALSLFLAGFLLSTSTASALKVREVDSNLREVGEKDVKFKQSETDHFKMASQRALEKDDYMRIRKYLKEVRRDVGRHLRIYPEEEFQVILSEPEVFRSYTGTPEHVAGLFDGRIHIPVPSEVDKKFLKSILWHEYTHAMIYSLTGGKTLVWLNEGTASYMQAKIEKRDLSFTIAHVQRNEKLPLSLQELEMVFRTSQQQPPEAVAVAYQEANLLVEYLFEKHESYKIKKLLKRAAETDLDSALELSLNLKETEFVRKAVEYIKQRYR